VIQDPPGASYFEAIIVAIRGAGQRMAAVGGYLGSAEQAALPAWKWQLLSAAGRAHAEAIARLDEADERLNRLGGSNELPAPLDQLPQRLEAMRADLRAAEDRIQKALAEAVTSPVGSA
jgi:hypothetical protein